MCQRYVYHLKCSKLHKGYTVSHTSFCPEVIQGANCLTSTGTDTTVRQSVVNKQICPGCLYFEACKKLNPRSKTYTASILAGLEEFRNRTRQASSRLLETARSKATIFDDLAIKVHSDETHTTDTDRSYLDYLLNKMRTAVHAWGHHNAYLDALDHALIVARCQSIPLSWGGKDRTYWFEDPTLALIETTSNPSCQSWYPPIYHSQETPTDHARSAEATDNFNELVHPMDIARDHAERHHSNVRERSMRRVSSRENLLAASSALLWTGRRRSKAQRRVEQARSRSQDTMSSDRSARSEVDPSEVVVPLSPNGML